MHSKNRTREENELYDLLVTLLGSQDIAVKVFNGEFEIDCDCDKPDGIASQRAKVLGDFFNVDSSLLTK